MGYMICNMPNCKSISHGAHDANGRNLCRKCSAAYRLGIDHAKLEAQGFQFTYKLGGETWEKA